MVRLPATTECSTPCDRAGADKHLDNRRQVLSELLLEVSPLRDHQTTTDTLR